MFESFKNIPANEQYKKKSKDELKNSLPFGFYDAERTYEKFSNVLNKFHDEKVPIIFLTWSSSGLYGYMIREAWKHAYPGENIPDFYFINPKPVKTLHSLNFDKKRYNEIVDLAEGERERINGFLKSIIDKNPEAKVGLFDEAYNEEEESKFAIGARTMKISKEIIETEFEILGVKQGDNRIIKGGLGIIDRTAPYLLFVSDKEKLDKHSSRKKADILFGDNPDSSKIAGKEAIEVFKKIGREMGEKIRNER